MAVIAPGSTMIDTVKSGVEELAERQAIDPADVSGVIEAGQMAQAGEEYVYPGDTVLVELEQNERGGWRVNAERLDGDS